MYLKFKIDLKGLFIMFDRLDENCCDLLISNAFANIELKNTFY
jgi:hypothetical protein